MDRNVSPVFDSLDIDLVFKVLKNTLFSTWNIRYSVYWWLMLLYRPILHLLRSHLLHISRCRASWHTRSLDWWLLRTVMHLLYVPFLFHGSTADVVYYPQGWTTGSRYCTEIRGVFCSGLRGMIGASRLLWSLGVRGNIISGLLAMLNDIQVPLVSVNFWQTPLLCGAWLWQSSTSNRWLPKIVNNALALNHLGILIFLEDNVVYYKCDVSKWEEVEAVSKKIVEEVCLRYWWQWTCYNVDRPLDWSSYCYRQ